jgi:hypothetical protein
VVFDYESDYLCYLNRSQTFAQFQQLSQHTLNHYLCLHSWLARYPFKIMENAEIWQQLLAVCAYFVKHPQPDCYIRQLDITGVDTKFIEARKGLLSELLDKICPKRRVQVQVITALNAVMAYAMTHPLVVFGFWISV